MIDQRMDGQHAGGATVGLIKMDSKFSSGCEISFLQLLFTLPYLDKPKAELTRTLASLLTFHSAIFVIKTGKFLPTHSWPKMGQNFKYLSTPIL